MSVTVGEITYTVGMDLENMLDSQKQVNTSLDQMETRFNKSAKSADHLETSMNKLASAIKLVIASSFLREMAGMVQRFQEMSERVQMATSSQEEFEHVQQRLLKTANGTYRALSEAQELYITTAASLRSMNYTTDQAIDIQDSMSYAFVKNATSADRANGAISAFSKSINKGKVEADSWETIIAAIPSVIGDIATASGKSSAEIRALGSTGKITAQQLSEGLRQSLEANATAAAGMSNNFTDAGVRMKTAITAILVEAEKGTGALQSFTNGIISAADALLNFSGDAGKMSSTIDAATIALGAFGGVIAGRLITSLASATKGQVENIATSAKQSTTTRQLAKDELGAATAIQRRAVVEKESAITERQRAVEALNALKATNASTVAEVAHADAELASIKVNLQQIQAEKALEVQRAKSQITEQGRIATSTRMAQLRQAESALTQQAARAESVAQNARAVAYESANARIAAANATVTTTTAAARTANGALATAQERLTATSLTLTGAIKSVNSALMPLGGVAGIVMMVAAGWYMYAQNQEAARQKNIDFADTLPDLINRMKDLNAVQLQGLLGDTAKSITSQQERIAELTESVKEAEREYKNYTEAAKALGGVQDQSNGHVKNAMKWFHTLAQRKRDLNDATARLNTTLNQQSLIQEQVNQKARESEEAFNVIANNLRNKIPGASEATITALATTIHFIDQLNKRAGKVSVQPNEPTESPEAKKLIQNAERRLALSKQEGEARARLQAQYDAEDVGYSKDDPYTRQLQDSYAATERATQARKESNAEGKKTEKQAESVAQRIGKLSNQYDILRSSIDGNTQAATMEQARLALGEGATEKQVQAYARLIEKKEALNQVRSNDPVIQEMASYNKMSAALKTVYEDDLLTQDQYNQRSAQLELQHQANLAKIRAEQSVANPIADMRGQVDPVQQVVNQNNQKLAAMREYQAQEQALLAQSYANNKLTHDQYTAAKSATDAQYLALRTAQEKQFNEQMTAAQWDLLSQQGLGYDMLTSAVDAFAGSASNAITGLLTGTMSASDAMRSLGNTILNSVVNSMVQVGVEMLKNFIIAQVMGPASQMANTTAAIAGGAAALAAWSPAAIAASIATAGAASGTGLGAYMTAQATGKAANIGMSVLGARKNGGPVSAGGLYQVGEGGMPEIYQASNGKQYMIPGDNGSVISNKDMRNGGMPNVSIQFIDQSTGNKSFDAQASMNGDELTVTAFIRDMEQGGPMSQSITRNTTATRRARG